MPLYLFVGNHDIAFSHEIPSLLYSDEGGSKWDCRWPSFSDGAHADLGHSFVVVVA